MIKMLRFCLGLALGAIILAGCGTAKDIVYFEDLEDGTLLKALQSGEVVIQPEDKLSIIVNTRDYQLTNLFNLPYTTQRLGSTAESSGNYSQGVSGYTVDSKGEIDFPVLGKLKIAGMQRSELEDYITERLLEENLVKDPVVTVEFMNLSVSVLGEVTKPGRYAIDKDRISILEAISKAGDLTIYGKRKPVTVIRETPEGSKAYQVDLTSSEELYGSEVFYLKQNDIVYVQPNKMRSRQSTVNGNNILSTSFWVSVGSLLISMCVLIFK